MSDAAKSPQARLPAVDRLLNTPQLTAAAAEHGRALTVATLREVLAEARATLGRGDVVDSAEDALAGETARRLSTLMTPDLRRVFNLTGTVLHTNLGRAPLPPEAIEAMTEVARGASNLEYDLARGRRGDRDDHLEAWLCRLTGAEAATVVNNNAAAVLLVLNSLARRKEVAVSRGELIEIGGAFRMPDIMARAGCRLVEVGTTNRTHARDYTEAIGPRSAALMKVHTSNYVVEGFTAAVGEAELAELAHAHDLPLISDLGSGSLVDLSQYGLPAEPTVADTWRAGADVVTFSGDKLLGGPQAGLIVGRRELIARIKKNPMKRAMRCDKLTIAALGAVLRLHADPERLRQRLPALALLTRPLPEIEALAARLRPVLQNALGADFAVTIADTASQIGSGSLPVGRLPSKAVTITWARTGRGSGAALKRLAGALRRLPLPVIGRVQDDALWLDLRCLDDEDGFVRQLGGLRPDAGR